MSYRQGDRLVGGYEVLGLLGRGAHGVVLKVKGPAGAGRIRAVKVLPCDEPRHADTAARKARDAAFAEARLLQRLRYPHIVGCEDVIWDSGRRAVQLVLEFMDGGDLRGLIEARRSNREPFEAHFSRRVLAAVGGALVYIHAVGVLHRDVKPANILLTRHSQRIKLADFGIAKLLETSHANTVVGTPHYLSPEIVAGQAYGEPSDGWALGVCLHEVVALCRPFDAGNQLALVRKICEDPPPSLPDHVAKDVRKAVEGLLVKPQPLRMPLREALGVSSAVAALVPGGTGSKSVLPAPASKKAPAPVPVAAPVPTPPGSPAASPVSSTASSSCRSASPNGQHNQRPESCRSTSSSPSPSGSRLGIVPTASADDAHAAHREQVSYAASPEQDVEVAEAGTWDASWCGSEAVSAAREALCGDVDDPEELVRALAALEREREDGSLNHPFTAVSSDNALDALESELRLRIAALRKDAAAMLSAAEAEAEADADDTSATSSPAPLPAVSSLLPAPDRGVVDADSEDDVASCLGSAPSALSSPRPSFHSSRAATAYEQALEVATSLGVDTEPSEERLARKRGMLSLRVKWGGVARFCLLPVSVGFDSLVAEVSRRFGLPPGSALPPLSWREAGESFQLKGQDCWEECLQRRGLVAQPGRLELCVDSSVPPPTRVTVHLRATSKCRFPAALEAFANAPSPLGQRSDLFAWRPPNGHGDRTQLASRNICSGRTRNSVSGLTGAAGNLSSGVSGPPRSQSRCGAANIATSEDIPPSLATNTATSSRLHHQPQQFHSQQMQQQHQQRHPQTQMQSQRSLRFGFGQGRYAAAGYGAQESSSADVEVWGPGREQLLATGGLWPPPRSRGSAGLEHVASPSTVGETSGAGLSPQAAQAPSSLQGYGCACGSCGGCGNAGSVVMRSSSRPCVQVRWRVTPGDAGGSAAGNTGGRDCRVSTQLAGQSQASQALPAPARVGLQVNGRAVLQ